MLSEGILAVCTRNKIFPKADSYNTQKGLPIIILFQLNCFLTMKGDNLGTYLILLKLHTGKMVTETDRRTSKWAQ